MQDYIVLPRAQDQRRAIGGHAGKSPRGLFLGTGNDACNAGPRRLVAHAAGTNGVQQLWEYCFENKPVAGRPRDLTKHSPVEAPAQMALPMPRGG